MKLSWIKRPLFSVVATALMMIGNQACLADDHGAKTEAAQSEFARTFNSNEERLVRVWLSGGTDSLIGAQMVPAEEVLRVQLGLTEGQGLAITKVDKDSAAAKAGIQSNDVLITVGDKTITDVESFHKQLQESVDKTVKIGYIRSGNRHVAELIPKHSQAELDLRADRLIVGEPARFRLGVGLAGADATLRSQLNIPESEGLVVTSVEPDSPAVNSGVMINDVLLKLDGKALKTIEELSASLQEIGEKSVTLELLRRGKPATLSVTPQKLPQGNLSFRVHRGAALESFFFTIPEKGGLGSAASIPIDLSTVPGFTSTALVGVPNSVVLYSPVPTVDPAKANLADQLSRLIEQTRQLQASLEALNTTIHNNAAPANKPDPAPAKP